MYLFAVMSVFVVIVVYIKKACTVQFFPTVWKLVMDAIISVYIKVTSPVFPSNVSQLIFSPNTLLSPQSKSFNSCKVRGETVTLVKHNTNYFLVCK